MRMMRLNFERLEWATCAVCGALQDREWMHSTAGGELCPNCWHMFVRRPCLVEETQRVEDWGDDRGLLQG